MPGYDMGSIMAYYIKIWINNWVPSIDKVLINMNWDYGILRLMWLWMQFLNLNGAICEHICNSMTYTIIII